MSVIGSASLRGRLGSAGQDLRRTGVEPRKYRIPLVSGRVASRSWSHRADAVDVGGEVDGELRVGRARQARSRRVTISAIRFVPMRQGIVLPHASPEQNRVSDADELDDAGPVVDDDDRARADVGADRAQPLEGVGRVERVRRQQPPDGPPTRTALRVRPAGSLPPSADDVPQRRAQGTSATPSPRGACAAGRGPCRGVVVTDRGERLRPLTDDPRHGGERLDVVDDRRHPA